MLIKASEGSRGKSVRVDAVGQPKLAYNIVIGKIPGRHLYPSDTRSICRFSDIQFTSRVRHLGAQRLADRYGRCDLTLWSRLFRPAPAPGDHRRYHKDPISSPPSVDKAVDHGEHILSKVDKPLAPYLGNSRPTQPAHVSGNLTTSPCIIL